MMGVTVQPGDDDDEGGRELRARLPDPLPAGLRPGQTVPTRVSRAEHDKKGQSLRCMCPNKVRQIASGSSESMEQSENATLLDDLTI